MRRTARAVLREPADCLARMASADAERILNLADCLTRLRRPLVRRPRGRQRRPRVSAGVLLRRGGLEGSEPESARYSPMLIGRSALYWEAWS